jgi:hypothetical protein
MIRIQDGLLELKIAGRTTSNDVAEVKSVLASKANEEEKSSIRDWLFPDGINTEAAFHAALSMKHAGTGMWFLTSKEFEAWTHGSEGCLWLYGIG